jgi:ketosteroid isomerase-like protein
MPDTNAEVRNTLDRFMRAVEAADTKRVMEFFEEDAQMFSPLGAYPARLDGRDVIGGQFATIAALVKQSPSPLKIDPYDMTVRSFGDVALVTCHLRMPGPQQRRTFVMHRGRDGWRFAHIHASIASPAQ